MSGLGQYDTAVLMMKVLNYMRNAKLFPPGYDDGTAHYSPRYGPVPSPIVLGSVEPGGAPEFFEVAYGIMVNDQHGLTLHGYDGSMAHTRLDGVTETTRPVFRTVVIADVQRVRSHQVLHVLGGKSHRIEFEYGGFFSFSLDSKGKLFESMEKGVTKTCSPDGKVLYLHGSASQSGVFHA